MTKKEKELALLLQVYDKRHIQYLMKQQKVLDQIYESLAREAARIGKASGFDDDTAEFYFDDFPATKKRIDEMIGDFTGKLETTIQEGSKREWLLSNDKNKALINSLYASTGIPKETIEKWTRPNLDALQAFQQRKIGGMNLSKHVWNLGEQTKSQLELALDIGLGEGKSAADLSRDVRKYLKEPEKLFRRVRDKHGNLRLSKNAAAYHPGQGVYRSSYKNALRLTATENNMAYRTADHDKWNSLDMVIGIHIQLSNNHTIENSKGQRVPFHDICDEMVGDYPKDFKFTGWHPFCRCIATPIVADFEEQLKVMEMEMNGEDVSNYHYEGEITEMPEGYNKWMEDNAERIEKASSMPYFIEDNYVGGDVKKGLNWESDNTYFPIKDMEIDDAKKYAEDYFDNKSHKDLDNMTSSQIEDYIKEDYDEKTKHLGEYAKEYSSRNQNVDELLNKLNEEKDYIERNKIVKEIQKECAVIAKKDLEDWSAVKGLKYNGIEEGYVLGKNKTYTTTSGEKVKTKRQLYDLVTFTDNNGQSYKYPIGMKETDVIVNAGELSKEFDKLPEWMKKHNSGFVIINKPHPIDEFYKKEYKDFERGAMYSSDPISIHHKYESASEAIYAARHEIGHHIYDKYNLEKVYEKIVELDNEYFTLNYGRIYTPSIYGENALTEDFADSLRFMSIDKHKKAMNAYPNRYKFLMKVISALK